MKIIIIIAIISVFFNTSFGQSNNFSKSILNEIDNISSSIDSIKDNWSRSCGDGISKLKIFKDDKNDTLLKWSISLWPIYLNKDSLIFSYYHCFYYKHGQLIKAVVSINPMEEEDSVNPIKAIFYFVNSKLVGTTGKFIKELTEEEIIACSNSNCFSFIEY